MDRSSRWQDGYLPRKLHPGGGVIARIDLTAVAACKKEKCIDGNDILIGDDTDSSLLIR